MLARILQDADVAGRFAGEMLRRGLGDALVFCGALTMLLVIDRRLFGLILLIAPLGVIGHSAVASAIRRRSHRAQQRLGGLSSRFAEQVSGHRTIKGYHTESAEEERFALENRAYADAVLGVERWTAFSLSSIWLVTGVALLVVALYAGRALAAGWLAPGDFLIFCLFGAQVVEPVRRLGELSTLAQRGLAAGQRLYDVLDRCGLETLAGEVLPQPVRGAIGFESVSFGYSLEQAVVAEVTFAVAARETIAVVAASGGGKSTLAALLVRFYTPRSGVIRLDGRDLSALQVAEVRRCVKVVTQDPFLFAGSVLENLCYGTSGVSSSLIDEAVQRTGLESWLRTLPAGLDTRVDEAGRNLSAGQKQRLALGRAIVAQPVVLVLDEATSAVDSDSEEQIMAQLADWLRQRTVILMAHRLSTVLRVPRVVVLEGGRVVEDGPPQVLLRRESHFARIFRDQWI
ncbi:MAG: ABC transporter ATP-binding protein [Deltaproteobacteria bacterium]|nr:ABC transporter ATP-binding protein [Deltaproteobacteria bacterium]